MGLRWSYEDELPAPQLLLHAIRLTAHRRSPGRLSDTTDAAPYKSIKVVQCDQTSVFASSRMLRSEEVIRPLQRSVQLPLIGEVSHGNDLDYSPGAVFARWRGLGILSLAPLNRAITG